MRFILFALFVTVFRFFAIVQAAPLCGALFATKFNELKSVAQILPEPLPISSYLKIAGTKKLIDANGKEVGEVVLIEPISSNVESLKNSRGGLEKYETEITDSNRRLFEALGFKETIDPVYGKYMSQIPSSKLFEFLRAQYNLTVPEDMQIHMGIYDSPVVSAKQTEFVTYWVKYGTIALGDPKFGSFFGLTPEQIAQAVQNGKENNSVYRHDLEHFGSIVLMPKKIIDFNRHIGQFWLKVIEHLKVEVTEGRIGRHSEEWHQIMNAAYLYTRRFHSLHHVLGMLVRDGGSIDINTQNLTDFGSVAQIETPAVHWSGLGFKPNWVTSDHLPKSNRHMYQYGLDNAQTVEQPISIAAAYKQVTNIELDFIRQFTNSHPTFQKTYQNILVELYLDTQPKLTDQDFENLQKLTMRRHQKMGNE